ncbi:MAG TPA: hypothetical protein VGS00_05730 [Thermoanaerobaculia bacterium]|nr:hypothetical protein [Thermoanaerobaculia bacterium]
MRTNEQGFFSRAAALLTALAFAAAAAPEEVFARQAAPHGPDRQSPTINIVHEPLVCVNTDFAPKVDAEVRPGPDYEKGYVYFRAAGTEDYYYAVLKGTPDKLDAVLPRPMPETKSIDYNLKAYDTAELTKKTREYTPPVVPGNACPAKGVAVDPQKGAGLTIGLTREGQNPAPPGFRKEDIKFVILFGGAVVTLVAALKSAAAAVPKSGGLSSGTIVAGGVVVAGAAVGIAVATNKKPTPTPAPLRFVQAEATWSGLGEVDIQILNASNQSVGQTFPSACESTGSRTERVVLEGAALANGTYHVVLTGKTCGAGTPSAISAVVTVQSEAGAKCGSTFVNVPVGGTANGCTFSVP